MITEVGFTIFPAIDLRNGKVVRLAQGDPARQTVYGDDPRAWAERWKAEGAAWLHVINLSGAFDEDPQANYAALKEILTVGLKVEFGGGIRNEESILAALELGVERVFLGTAAIQDPALVERAIAQFGPARIAGDIGARNGQVSMRGWQEQTTLTASEIGQRLRTQGMEWCVFTDVSRDGTGRGVNIDGALELQKDSGLKVVASGGVSRMAEVQQARSAGLAGIILGRALYDGKISLRECFASPAAAPARGEGEA
ncbi:MAG TPA: 1-(5-phosphoribosyl)-5-[(5-phosphoribosylamino)methylideneamino] imidazole-4-carboxamide isomerase [Anaerolineales bacterium]|jgi:phosphoribosylformimino-5-aminoimidazole carboxamide ribotide isomerase